MPPVARRSSAAERRSRRADQLGDLGLVERPDLDVPGDPVVDRAGDVGGEVGVDLERPVGADQQHPTLPGPSHEEPEQLARGPVGPVQVVEDQHERLVPRDQVEQRTDGDVAADPLLRGQHGQVARPARTAQRRQQRGQL